MTSTKNARVETTAPTRFGRAVIFGNGNGDGDGYDYRRAKLREFGCWPYPMPFTRAGELGEELVAFQRWVIQRKDEYKPWSEWWGRARGNPRKLGSRRVSLPLFAGDGRA